MCPIPGTKNRLLKALNDLLRPSLHMLSTVESLFLWPCTVLSAPLASRSAASSTTR